MNFPFESKLQPILDIKERNTAFHQLTNTEKRKEIALDLFLLILDEILSPSYSYWGGTKLESMVSINNTPDEICRISNTIEKQDACEVCVRGGMMLSQIRLGNRLGYHSHMMCGYNNLLDGFTMDEFEKMEAVYERYGSYGGWVENHPFEHNGRRSLLNICLNVMVNGRFNHMDFTNYIKKFNIITTGKNKFKIK